MRIARGCVWSVLACVTSCVTLSQKLNLIGRLVHRSAKYAPYTTPCSRTTYHPGRILHYPRILWEGIEREGRRGGGNLHSIRILAQVPEWRHSRGIQRRGPEDEGALLSVSSIENRSLSHLKAPFLSKEAKGSTHRVRLLTSGGSSPLLSDRRILSSIL